MLLFFFFDGLPFQSWSEIINKNVYSTKLSYQLQNLLKLRFTEKRHQSKWQSFHSFVKKKKKSGSEKSFILSLTNFLNSVYLWCLLELICWITCFFLYLFFSSNNAEVFLELVSFQSVLYIWSLAHLTGFKHVKDNYNIFY